MNLKTGLILMLISAVISAAVTRYYWPKLEVKNVEVQKEVVRNDIRTVYRTIERPDGTKETIKETTDKSVKQATSSKESTIFSRKDWVVSTSAGTRFSNFEPIYGLQVQRRILGPFYVGAVASTDKMVGVSVGLEF